MSNRYIDIGPYNYRVTWSAKVHAAKEREHGVALFGCTDEFEQLITIHPNAPQAHQRVTLLHEALHAIFKLVDIGVSDEVEESIIVRLAPALVDMFLRNPWVADYVLTDTNHRSH